MSSIFNDPFFFGDINNPPADYTLTEETYWANSAYLVVNLSETLSSQGLELDIIEVDGSDYNVTVYDGDLQHIIVVNVGSTPIEVMGLAGGDITLESGERVGLVQSSSGTWHSEIEPVNQYEFAFSISDWVDNAGESSLTIPASQHGLGSGLRHVSVFDSDDDSVTLVVNVEPTTGNVVISISNNPFDGSILIS